MIFRTRLLARGILVVCGMCCMVLVPAAPDRKATVRAIRDDVESRLESISLKRFTYAAVKTSGRDLVLEEFEERLQHSLKIRRAALRDEKSFEKRYGKLEDSIRVQVRSQIEERADNDEKRLALLPSNGDFVLTFDEFAGSVEFSYFNPEDPTVRVTKRDQRNLLETFAGVSQEKNALIQHLLMNHHPVEHLLYDSKRHLKYYERHKDILVTPPLPAAMGESTLTFAGLVLLDDLRAPKRVDFSGTDAALTMTVSSWYRNKTEYRLSKDGSHFLIESVRMKSGGCLKREMEFGRYLYLDGLVVPGEISITNYSCPADGRFRSREVFVLQRVDTEKSLSPEDMTTLPTNDQTIVYGSGGID